MHDLYRIERYVCSRGDDVQRSIELLDKVLSEYDEHEAEGEGGGGVGVGVGSGGGGGGDGSGGGSGGGVGDCGSSTEPSIGLTPDDESPSLGIFYPFFVFFFPLSFPFSFTPFSVLFPPFISMTFAIMLILCLFFSFFYFFHPSLFIHFPYNRSCSSNLVIQSSLMILIENILLINIGLMHMKCNFLKIKF